MLITGQPDKMLRDLRNSKRSRELSATLMEILVSGDNINVLNTVFSVRIFDSMVKVRDTAMSLLHCSPAYTFPNETINRRLVIPLLNTACRQSVPSELLFSITFGFVASF
jgi:hypothetical protein